MSSTIADARDLFAQAFDALRGVVGPASGVELCEVLRFCEEQSRRLDQVQVSALAAAEREDVFGSHGYRSTPAALADLLRWEPLRSRRFATAAEQVEPTVALDGTVLAPKLPATATVFGSGEISMRHAEVIATVLGTKAAQRLTPVRWAGAEEALAAHAPDYTPSELRVWGTQLIEALDQDGPEPDDDRPRPQINEVHVSPYRDRPGGTIRGRFEDAEMFDRIATVLDAHAGPGSADDPRDRSERQAEALAEVCGYALAHAPSQVLPETGGRRPQLVVTIRLDDLERRARAAMLDVGGQLTPAALRMLACDAAVVPIVMGGNGEPLDVGRARRTVPDGLRRAVAVRDRGCAFPGCDRPPSWCEIHHVIPWEHHGPTELGNLTMLCRLHHRVVHHSGWIARIVDGRPEFVPPGWIDPRRRPRRKPDITTLREFGLPELDEIAVPSPRSAEAREPVPPGRAP